MVSFYTSTQYEMAVEEYHQCDERRVDELEPQIAADDVADTLLQRSRHTDDILKDQFRQSANHQA